MFYIYNICDRTTTKSSVSSLTVTYFRKDLIHVFEATRASQVVLVVKNPPASAGDARDMVQCLGWEDPLE